MVVTDEKKATTWSLIEGVLEDTARSGTASARERTVAALALGDLHLRGHLSMGDSLDAIRTTLRLLSVGN